MGSYLLGSENLGFLRDVDGTFQTIAYDRFPVTSLFGINDSGRVVGEVTGPRGLYGIPVPAPSSLVCSLPAVLVGLFWQSRRRK